MTHIKPVEAATPRAGREAVGAGPSEAAQPEGLSEHPEVDAGAAAGSAYPPNVLPVARLHGPIPLVINTEQQLSEAIGKLAAISGPSAIDTERAQGFRYGQECWLIQIKRGQAGTFLIDSHALSDLHELCTVLDDVWIFHSATQDLPSLGAVGMVAPELFDTETAARLVGMPRFSLAALVEDLLGMTLEKSHQSEDWSVRPLPKEWLRYAAMDVELLDELRAILTQKLTDLGRMEWARQEFDHQLTNVLAFHEPYWRELKGIGALKTRRELAYARELFNAREKLARRLDLSPSRLLSRKGIIEAAKAQVATRSEMMRIREFTAPRARPHRDTFWMAIQRARALTDAELPSTSTYHSDDYVPPAKDWKRLSPEAFKRLTAVRSLVAGRAKILGLDPEVLLQPKAQRRLAWEPLERPAIELAVQRVKRELARPWQVEQIEIAVEASPEFLEKLTV